MRLLITGFEPYHKVKFNSSMAVIGKLADILLPLMKKHPKAVYECTSEILKSEFYAAEKRMAELLRELSPEVAVSLGTSPLSNVISLERFAVNLRDASYPDNAGKKPQEERIAPDGPVAYQSPFSLLPLQERLRENGIPAAVSNSAGTFVCNAVMFSALYTVATMGLPTRYLFLHLPALPEEVASRMEDGYFKNGPSMAVEVMEKAVTDVIGWLAALPPAKTEK